MKDGKRSGQGWSRPEVSSKDSLPHLAWPVLKQGNSSSLLALLYQLEDTQWWPVERIERHQLAQRGQLVEHAYLTVGATKKRLRGAGYRAGKPLSPELWQALPVLTRRDLQALDRELDSRPVPAAHGGIFEARTSGSTGRPVAVRKTDLSQLFWEAITLRDHLWHRRDLSASLAAVRFFRENPPMPPEGFSTADWGPPASSVFRTGPGHSLHLVSDIGDQVDWLARRNPAYLLTHPSNALALAQECERKRIALPGLREVRTLGEVCDPSVRDACRRIWGVPVTDIYSTQEVGYIALQCPEHEHYHVQSEVAYVEILDAAGRPCAPGQVGRVVVTPLHNFATPLLRYEVGDFAEVGEPCPCGRGLPVLTRILGRVRNLVTFPDGRRRWPGLGLTRIGEIAPVRQVQVIQRALDRLEVRAVAERPLTAAEEEGLSNFLSTAIGYAFAMDFRYYDEIPRSASGKYEEFISELETAAT